MKKVKGKELYHKGDTKPFNRRKKHNTESDTELDTYFNTDDSNVSKIFNRSSSLNPLDKEKTKVSNGPLYLRDEKKELQKEFIKKFGKPKETEVMKNE